MQFKSVLFGAAVAAACFLATGRVFSDDPPKGGPDPEMMKLTKPGPEHEMLKAREGTWEGKGTYQGMSWTSTMTGKMVMGGRFLQLEEEITVPTPNGPMVMHMLVFVGYDNLRKKYVNMGIGDDSTTFMQAEGRHDEAKKWVEMTGVEHRPGGKDVPYRFTISDVVDGASHMEWFADEGSGEQKMLVGDYKKK